MSLSRQLQPVGSLFPLPLVGFDLAPDQETDELLSEWGHFLGPCNRPFGRQSFALTLDGSPVAVAVSASTVNAKCAGRRRDSLVELARLCSHPEHRDMTRVALRLWRKVAPTRWPYWPCSALVAYADSTRHAGDIYRFDGWQRYGAVRGGKAGGGWNRRKEYNPKTVWVYVLEEREC